MNKVKGFFLFSILFFLIINTITAQPNPSDPNIHRDVNIKSPIAGSLGQYTQIPVSLFNGSPVINAPLYELNYRGIKVPIELNYNASGNRPDVNPGWVGLGWSLEAGGLITRQVNVEPDEYYIGHPYWGPIGNYYLDKHKLSVPDWNMKPLAILDGADEFVFNFLGMGGSFFLDHTGKWRIRSKDGLQFDIQHEVKQNVQVINPDGTLTILSSTYTKFILIGTDGTKYIFGDDPNAIEFTRSPAFESNPEVTNTDDLLISNTWHLKQIISPKGIVTFNYQREFNMTQTLYSEVYWDYWLQYPFANPETDRAQDINMQHHYINYESYLSSIQADQNVSIVFNKSIAYELKYPAPTISFRGIHVHDVNNGAIDHGAVREGFFGSSTITAPKFFKLDEIKIIWQGQNVVKNISLEYIENVTERLKLSKVNINSPVSPSEKASFAFEYNALKLPAYNKGMEDHWGYYNGRNYFNSITSVNGSIPNINAYYLSREANPDFLQAEILKKMIYPTGGFTEFEYEPHDYSAIVRQYPIGLESLSENKIAGGLRIKKIIYNDGASQVPLISEYFYTKNFISGGTISSGVVSGLPQYYESGYMNINYPNATYEKFSSNALNYLNHTNGNHITYSEVIEKSQLEGYFWYKYSNHDNGYLDKPPFNVIPDGWSPNNLGIAYNKTFGRLDLERGLLLEKRCYTKDKILIQKEVNEYNSDPNRYENYVRGYQKNYGIATLSANIAYPIFTFWPYIKKHTEYTYNQAGNNPVVQSTIYAYNGDNLVQLEQTQNSKGETVTTTFKYPGDFAGIAPLQAMTDAHILSPVVESATSNTNTGPVSGTKVIYYSPFTGIYVPQRIQAYEGINPLETKQEFYQYDSKGNILEYAKAGDVHEVILWGYNGQYPVARITNATYSQVIGYISTQALDNPATDDQLRSMLNIIRTQLPSARVFTYTYDPLVGMTSETDDRGRTTYYCKLPLFPAHRGLEFSMFFSNQKETD